MFASDILERRSLMTSYFIYRMEDLSIFQCVLSTISLILFYISTMNFCKLAWSEGTFWYFDSTFWTSFYTFYNLFTNSCRSFILWLCISLTFFYRPLSFLRTISSPSLFSSAFSLSFYFLANFWFSRRVFISSIINFWVLCQFYPLLTKISL